MSNDLAPLLDIYRQTTEQQRQLHDELIARQDAAQEIQRKQQADLEKRTELSDQYKDISSKVGSVVERDFSLLGTYLDNYNKDLENAHAIELGLDAPHASSSLARDLALGQEMRWLDSGPDFAAEEREFHQEDRDITQNDNLETNPHYQAHQSEALRQSPRLNQNRLS